MYRVKDMYWNHYEAYVADDGRYDVSFAGLIFDCDRMYMRLVQQSFTSQALILPI